MHGVKSVSLVEKWNVRNMVSICWWSHYKCEQLRFHRSSVAFSKKPCLLCPREMRTIESITTVFQRCNVLLYLWITLFLCKEGQTKTLGHKSRWSVRQRISIKGRGCLSRPFFDHAGNLFLQYTLVVLHQWCKDAPPYYHTNQLLDGMSHCCDNFH